MELKIIHITGAVFLLVCIMSMSGRGGGHFYVLLLLASGFSITAAAANAQLILMTTALLATVFFYIYKTVDWEFALVLDPATDNMAFFGGFFPHHFMNVYSKSLFVLLLLNSAFFMIKPARPIIVDQFRYYEAEQILGTIGPLSINVNHILLLRIMV